MDIRLAMVQVAWIVEHLILGLTLWMNLETPHPLHNINVSKIIVHCQQKSRD